MKHLFLLTILTLAAVPGCTSIPQPDLTKFKPAGAASSVIAVWEPAVNTTGEKPVRGFGGRLYFYDQDKTRPVKVHGTVVVYVFNEENRSAENTKPDEGFVFDDKMLNSKSIYKKSRLGPSYNLWIPIDSEGPDGRAKKISLIVRYTSNKGGSAVTGEQATAYLPGKYPLNQMQANDPQRTYLPVSLNTAVPHQPSLTKEQMIENNYNRPNQMQTTVIR